MVDYNRSSTPPEDQGRENKRQRTDASAESHSADNDLRLQDGLKFKGGVKNTPAREDNCIEL